MSGAWPLCMSTAFTKGWYIEMVEQMDAAEQAEVHRLEMLVKDMERRLKMENMPNGQRIRLNKRLHETEQRLQETIDFYYRDRRGGR